MLVSPKQCEGELNLTKFTIFEPDCYYTRKQLFKYLNKILFTDKRDDPLKKIFYLMHNGDCKCNLDFFYRSIVPFYTNENCKRPPIQVLLEHINEEYTLDKDSIIYLHSPEYGVNNKELKTITDTIIKVVTETECNIMVTTTNKEMLHSFKSLNDLKDQKKLSFVNVSMKGDKICFLDN